MMMKIRNLTQRGFNVGRLGFIPWAPTVTSKSVSVGFIFIGNPRHSLALVSPFGVLTFVFNKGLAS